MPSEAGPAAPSDLSLSVQPNPLRSTGAVRFTLNAPADVSVSVVDVTGRVVARIHEGALGAGPHALRLDVRGLASGVYLVRVSGAGGVAAAQRVSVAR